MTFKVKKIIFNIGTYARNISKCFRAGLSSRPSGASGEISGVAPGGLSSRPSEASGEISARTAGRRSTERGRGSAKPLVFSALEFRAPLSTTCGAGERGPQILNTLYINHLLQHHPRSPTNTTMRFGRARMIVIFVIPVLHPVQMELLGHIVDSRTVID